MATGSLLDVGRSALVTTYRPRRGFQLRAPNLVEALLSTLS
jgi:hypothetical protein